MAMKKEVAEHLFITERQLHNIITDNPGAPVAKGRGGWDIDAMRKWYLQVLKQNNVSKSPDKDDDEDDSFAKRKQKLELEKLEADVRAKVIKNNKDLNAWGPIELLEYTISKLASNLSSRFEGLIPRLKISCNDLTPEMMLVLESEIIKFRNELADVEIDLTNYQASDFDSDHDRFSTSP